MRRSCSEPADSVRGPHRPANGGDRGMPDSRSLLRTPERRDCGSRDDSAPLAQPGNIGAAEPVVEGLAFDNHDRLEPRHPGLGVGDPGLRTTQCPVAPGHRTRADDADVIGRKPTARQIADDCCPFPGRHDRGAGWRGSSRQRWRRSPWRPPVARWIRTCHFCVTSQPKPAATCPEAWRRAHASAVCCVS
jgi:hypothetical protein